MAQAARAYRNNSVPAYAPDRGFSRPDVRPVRTARGRLAGAGAAAAGEHPQQASRSSIATLGRLAAVVIVLVAVLSFARIALTNATVTTLIESDAISTQIAEARSAGVGLEMQQSVLSSPSAINSAVKRLAMMAPAEVGTLALDPDVVAYDSDGVLSLSDSVKNVVESEV